MESNFVRCVQCCYTRRKCQLSVQCTTSKMTIYLFSASVQQHCTHHTHRVTQTCQREVLDGHTGRYITEMTPDVFDVSIGQFQDH